MLVIDDIGFLPVFDPVLDPEDLILVICRGTNDAVDAGVDDHFFADKTGEGVDRLFFSIIAAVEVHVSPQQADTSPGGVDDGVLLGVDTPAELIALTVGDVELIAEANSVLIAVLGLPGRPPIACGDDLVVADNKGADRAAEAAGPPRDFLSNPQVIVILGYSLGFHANFSSF